jgi:hypothetical protein
MGTKAHPEQPAGLGKLIIADHCPETDFESGGGGGALTLTVTIMALEVVFAFRLSVALAVRE